MTRACEEQAEEGERRVLVALPDACYHVKAVLEAGEPAAGGLLGLVVWDDDPQTAPRSEAASLLFVRPEQVLRIEVRGYRGEGRAFGFQG